MLPGLDVQCPYRVEKWSNKRHYFLSCIGYTLSIHHFLEFPITTYRNGGVVFLMVYFLLLWCCGIPIFLMESWLGQFSSIGSLTIFKICPLLKGCGFAILGVCINIICNYSVIVSYSFMYLFECFTMKDLPWMKCDNVWNTDDCLAWKSIDRYSDLSENNISKSVNTSAYEFLHHKISNKTDFPEIDWHLLLVVGLTWALVFLLTAKGVKSLGKFSTFATTFPLVLLSILFIRCVTLPGSLQGIYAFVTPQWNKLLTFNLWADATTQTFISLGLGCGGILNMATFNCFNKDNNQRDAIVVALGNLFNGIISGFTLFSLLGFMSYKTGTPFSKVTTGGSGLAFVTYPEAIALLPWSHLWCFLYFLMLALQGLWCVLWESVMSSIMDDYEKLSQRKVLVRVLLTLLIFLCSSIWFNNGGMKKVDYTTSVVTISLIELFVVGWAYGIKNFARDVEFMNRHELHPCWPLCWKFITPPILMIPIVLNFTVSYDAFSQWSSARTSGIMTLALILFYMGYKLLYYSEGDLFERISYSLKAGKKWGPSAFRNEWLLIVCKKHIFKMSKRGENPALNSLHKKFAEISTESEI